MGTSSATETDPEEKEEEIIMADIQPSDIPAAWTSMLRLIQGDKPEAIIAGGTLRDLDNGRPVKDIDVFVYGDGLDALESLRRRFVELRGIDCDEIDYEKVYPLGEGNDMVGFFVANFDDILEPVQIIMLRKDEDRGVIERMDYGICRMTFDGEILTRDKTYIEDREAKVFRLRVDRGPQGLSVSVHRFVRIVQKYEGWKFIPYGVDDFDDIFRSAPAHA